MLEFQHIFSQNLSHCDKKKSKKNAIIISCFSNSQLKYIHWRFNTEYNQVKIS